MLTPLVSPAAEPLRVVALMSGSGSNLRRLLEREAELRAERGRPPYTIAAIFSDNAESAAASIGRDFDVPVLIRDKRAYYRARQTPLRDLALRARYDAETVALLKPFYAQVAAYAGYMSIATAPLIDAFLGVNVHPADLSIEEAAGGRKYRGDHAVRDALLAGETALRSTTHLLTQTVDGGDLLMISPPVMGRLPEDATQNSESLKRAEAENQARLKEGGDWIVFPRTLCDLAEGRFARDERGLLHYDGMPIPRGLRLS